MRAFVTGGTGFVGRKLVDSLNLMSGYEVIRAVRSAQYKNDVLFDLGSPSEMLGVLNDCEAVIHCAGRAHVMNEHAVDPLAEYRKVNTEGTLNLARQAALASVKRFIFISSIKVNGESTAPGQPFTAEVKQPPQDPYAISKYEAEQELRALAEHTSMEVVIIRPPLVYGPGVKANFASLVNIVGKGLPLPLGAIHNRRSLVYVGNLVDLIINCLSNPKAANKTFLASDDDDLSTTDLLQGLALAMEKPSRLLPLPSSWLMTMTKLLGKPAIGERLCGNLQLDISDTKSCLGWTPPYSVAEGLKLTVTEDSRQK